LKTFAKRPFVKFVLLENKGSWSPPEFSINTGELLRVQIEQPKVAAYCMAVRSGHAGETRDFKL
jgi:hypothetical protein